MRQPVIRTLVSGALLLGVALASASAETGRKVTTETVDSGRVGAQRPAGDVHVFVKLFPTESADLGTAEKPGKEKAEETAEAVSAGAPITLATALANRLREHSGLTSVIVEGSGTPPEGALVVQGEFTLINPGSRGKRFWVGMGAGKSKICVKGSLVGPDGTIYASFDHCRVGTMGWYGGRAEGMMVTDVSQTGIKIAEFLGDWAAGKFADGP